MNAIMRIAVAAILLLLALGGCTKRAPQQNVPQHDQYIGEWAGMGMWLPKDDQVQYFAANFASSYPSLKEALAHPDHSVRMRAAYVLGEIDSPARTAGPDLLARLKNEPDVLVRIYIIDALIGIGYRGEDTVATLTQRFESLNGTNVPPIGAGSYAEVDEKITVASALYSLGEESERSTYFDFVTVWLKPIPKNVTGTMLDGYWERRWIAVNSLEHMRGATEAIPLMEAMRTENGAQSWVDTHVPRVVGALQRGER